MIIKRGKKSKVALHKDLEGFFKDYNCTYQTDVDNDTGSTRYLFDFQGGHFVALVRSADDCVEVTMPCMASAPLDELNMVRTKINERNYNNILFKFTYEVNMKENQLDVHLSFYNNAIRPDEFKSELSACFYFQREWINDYDKAAQVLRQRDSKDVEQDFYEYKHELFLVRQQEIAHQLNEPAASVLATSKEALTLQQLLRTFAPHVALMQPLFMTVNTVQGQLRLEDADAIMQLDLRRVLVQGEGKDATLGRDYAVLDYHYREGDDKPPHLLTMSLTAEGDDGKTMYTRVTMTLPLRNINAANSMHSSERNTPQCVSLLTGLDRTTQRKRMQEFDYMWKDAQLKLKNGEREAMDEDQLLLARVTAADVAYNVYWGDRQFHKGCYMDAIMHFENAFNGWRDAFFELDDDGKAQMLQIAYKLGFCYNELKVYDKAYYYLDLTDGDGNIAHTMELVNMLANSGDLRVFNVIDETMGSLRDHWEDDKDKDKENRELPESIMKLINFLRRRRAYALIEFGKLDEAEKVFTTMLDEEENADYAINELAYIKQVRSQQSGNNEEQDSQTPSPHQ